MIQDKYKVESDVIVVPFKKRKIIGKEHERVICLFGIFF